MDPPPMFQSQPPPMAPGAYPAAIATSPFLLNAFSSPNYGGIGANPTHPPYPEMITAAITRLKEIPKVKTSKKEIGECIASNYSYLSPSYMKLVTEYLKRMTDAGQLVRVGNSYFLPPPPGSGSDLPLPTTPASAAAASPAGFAGSSTLKKRGRPPKPKPSPAESLPVASEATGASTVLVNGSETSAKKRGRPRKVKPDPGVAFDHQEPRLQPAAYEAAPISGDNAGSTTPVLFNGSASLTKRRGRPRKDKATPVAEQALAVPSSTKRSPGRPKLGSRPRGRPRKTAVDMAAPPSTGRPRGRPRRNAVVAGGVLPVGMKRRGRPRAGVAGARWPLVGRTGRPVGRPRKYAQAAETQASDGRAKEELTRKLEYMQLKVRNAVGLLKPHLINANIIDIMTALQDLEELATMDIAPPTDATPVTVPISEPSTPTEASAPPVDAPTPSYAAYPVAPSQPPPSQPPVSATVPGMSG